MSLLLWARTEALGSTGDAPSGAHAVEGADRALILPPPGVVVADYENAGYRLRRTHSGRVTVDVDVSPLQSRVVFAPVREVGTGTVGRLARATTAGARTRYQAASRILAWVARNIRYDLDRTQDQGPADVLERRSGYCTGIARLCVALLQSVDIPAREVVGYVVGEAEAYGGYHRWVEILYEDRGWVFSDSLVSHHYVPASYVRLAADRIDPSRGRRAVLVERRLELLAVDVYHLAPRGITARRNSPRRLAAALRVSLGLDDPSGRAVLEGMGLRRTRSLSGAMVTFVGLEPGSYVLDLELGDGRERKTRLELRDRILGALDLTSAFPAQEAK